MLQSYVWAITQVIRKEETREKQENLTFDPEPGVASDVAGLVGGRALEHAAVLSSHVVDVQ